jgi:membrane-associated protease RseP (regulator of RpoE activity)
MTIGGVFEGTPMIQKILIALCLMCVVQPAFAAGRGYLGVWFGNLPATEKMVQTGVIVNKVYAGSAAQQAGLKPGEIVTQIDGAPVRDPKTAVALLAENAAGERVSLTVIDRSGGGIRRSRVLARLAANPPGEFAAIMTAKPMPFLRRRPCAGSAGSRDRPCRANVAAEH